MRYRPLTYRERTVSVTSSVTSPAADWRNFSGISTTVNHWNRPGWHPGRSAYYWYLTFENCPALQSMVRRCQEVVEQNPAFDLVAVNDVHMTLDRIAWADETSDDVIDSVEHEAAATVRRFPAFRVTVGPLSGSPGALSFSAAPFEPLNRLRLTLTGATRSIIDSVAPAPAFRPHVGIAYCNTALPAQPIIQAVDAVRDVPTVDVLVRHVSLVRLTRLERAYRWSARRRLLLGSEPPARSGDAVPGDRQTGLGW